MKHLDIFSGIGGFALAASWVWGDEHDIHSFVEIEPFCQKVLKKHWPDVPIHPNIKDYKHDGTAIDLLTGGFPCQPYSIAGKRGGATDDRAIWKEMLSVIKKAYPTWIIGENVANSLNMVIENAILDLEEQGYEVRPFDIPACSVEAFHLRQRIFIVAHAKSKRWGKIQKIQSRNIKESCGKKPKLWKQFQSVYCGAYSIGKQWKEYENIICRNDDGISQKLDKSRIKALGNAIVPQVVVPIMQAIKEIEGAE